MPLRSSIANRIFVIAGVLLALMTLVSVVNAVMSTRVGALIEAIDRTYLPAYSMLARAHVRSLEQSYFIRRAVIARLENGKELSSMQGFLDEADNAGAAADKELESALALLEENVRQGPRFYDDVQIGRLEAQITEIEDEHKRKNAQIATVVAALKANDRPAIEEALLLTDAERDRNNARIERARHDMLGLSRHAFEVTEANQWRVMQLTFVTLAIAAVVGLFLAFRVARNLVNSMRALMSATEAVEKGRYESELPVTSDDEIGRLSRSFNLMVAELRLKEKIRETFGRYVDPQLVEGLIERPELTGGAGDRRIMTIYFCDMKGFSGLSEEVTPASLVTLLNRYFTLMSDEIRCRSGVVDKYMGDAVMAFWGPPFTAPDRQGALACETALAQVERFEAFRAELPELLGFRKFMPEIGIRVGIATGEVIVGNIGSETAMNYTVMGDTVNTASRIEGANKLYGTSILVNEATAQLVRAEMALREIDTVLVVGKSEPITLYEVAGAGGAGDADPLFDRYAEGLAAYRRRDWSEAEAAFRACLERVPGDGPSAAMLRRLAAFKDSPPPEDWNAAWPLSEK